MSTAELFDQVLVAAGQVRAELAQKSVIKDRLREVIDRLRLEASGSPYSLAAAESRLRRVYEISNELSVLVDEL